MAPTWVRRLRDAIRPPTPHIDPPEPDPEHQLRLAEARRQGTTGDDQLREARRISLPMADTARRLTAAGQANHFSDAIEDMLRKGYGKPRGENR